MFLKQESAEDTLLCVSIQSHETGGAIQVPALCRRPNAGVYVPVVSREQFS